MSSAQPEYPSMPGESSSDSALASPEDPSKPKEPSFDENSRIYFHLCCHVKSLTIAVCILELMAITYNIIRGSGILAYACSEHKLMFRDILVVVLIWSVLQIVFIVTALYGVYKVRPPLVIPQTVLQAVTVVLCFPAMVYFAVTAGTAKEDVVTPAIAVGVTVALSAAYTYFSYILCRCYAFLRDKRQWMSTEAYLLPQSFSDPVSKQVAHTIFMYSEREMAVPFVPDQNFASKYQQMQYRLL